MSRKIIYLVGSAGFPNYGDELIAAQWLRYLALHEPDAEVWLDTPTPGNCVMLLDGLHPRLRFTDTLFHIAWSAPEEPAAIVEFAAEAVRNPGFLPRRAAGVELLQRVDVCHVLGGGYVNALWPRHLVILAAAGELAASFEARAAATGLGLMPAVTSTELLQRVTSDYQVVDARDAASRDLLASDRVTLSGDDSLLGLGPDNYDSRDSRSLMLNLQSDFLDDAGVQALAHSVTSTLQRWNVEGRQVGYVECMPDSDRRIFELIEDGLPEIRFYPFLEVARAGLPARRGQRWLTTRLHSHLMAAAAGAWGVAFPINDYYRHKHESVVAAGSRWAIVEPGETPKEHHGDAGFGSALDGLLVGKQAVADAIYTS